jgi:hypothetical protein
MLTTLKLTARIPTLTEAVGLILIYVVFKLIHYFGWKWYTSPLRELQFALGGEGPVGHCADMVR